MKTNEQIADEIWNALDHASDDLHIGVRGDNYNPKCKFRNSFNRPDGHKTSRLPGLCVYYVGYDCIDYVDILDAVEEARQYGKNVFLVEGNSPASIQYLANDPGERIFTTHKILYRHIEES